MRSLYEITRIIDELQGIKTILALYNVTALQAVIYNDIDITY